ncbi:hypothetical protein Tco_1044530 [Tanacetum coccineum]|uniref:Uncharacterized protein n=1 Tax=Tanacetum coccineum TaxID=301880 RepID=A0ABQ5GRB3_9ASTR
MDKNVIIHKQTINSKPLPMQGTKLQFKTVELLFRMSVVDTLRIIMDDHFRGTMQEEMQELGMQSQNIVGNAGTSNDSNIPFEVQDLDNYHDSVYEHHDVHEMQNNIQQDYVVDSEADYTSDSNIISYDPISERQRRTMLYIVMSFCTMSIEILLSMKMHEESALYNGTEIVMTNHKPAVVHDSEETLEIAELTRKRMYGKMKSPQCVQNKVKFAPPDYSKENYLAIFAPQRDLTPE